jgi:hypothetical protein
MTGRVVVVVGLDFWLGIGSVFWLAWRWTPTGRVVVVVGFDFWLGIGSVFWRA